ncbi:class A sortase [Liquorilactobacillus oeni]|uniref:Sortase n=1 Tax=Liquorilactobacillus oeni DSM 19972 TaxID=1423777 RepID=A0A0R1MK16_9LACO|nr:class A sortase [Liquorilactobacillus oeni]KRL05701.1 sortase [Liquorilactobacillus oeni DSM 19972]
MKKYKKVFQKVLIVLLLAIGLALVFNEQLKVLIIKTLTTSELQKKPKTVNKEIRKHGNFNFKSVKAADVQTLGKAIKNDSGSIGKISIPKVGLYLPIFYGIDNENLLRGAGTMKPAEKMGEGNYALAGHHMSNSTILFSPLAKVKTGMSIYLTDGAKVYRYRVVQKRTVDKYQINWINDVPQKKLVTLVTCLTATAGETNRILVQGELEQVQGVTKDTLRYFAD